MKGIQIVSTGKALPEEIITNDDLSRIVDTNDEWITTRTGIKKDTDVHRKILHHLQSEQHMKR